MQIPMEAIWGATSQAIQNATKTKTTQQEPIPPMFQGQPLMTGPGNKKQTLKQQLQALLDRKTKPKKTPRPDWPKVPWDDNVYTFQSKNPYETVYSINDKDYDPRRYRARTRPRRKRK